MKKVSIIVFLMFIFSGYSNNHDKLIGEWTPDIEKIRSSDDFIKLQKRVNRDDIVEAMLQSWGNTTWVFNKKNLITKILIPETGKVSEDKDDYIVLKDQGTILKFQVGKEKMQWVLEFIKKDLVLFHIENQTLQIQMYLKKVK